MNNILEPTAERVAAESRHEEAVIRQRQEQLNANRTVRPTARPTDESRRIAYQCGIAGLAPFIERMLAVEAKVAALTERLDAVEKKSAPVHLAKVERRA